MESNKQNKWWKVFIQIIVILAIGSGSIWIASLFSPKQKDETMPVVNCPLDTQSYQTTSSLKHVVLLTNKSSYGVNGSFSGHEYNVVLKRTGLNSKIACGYLFYKISIGDNPINQKYENLYMTPTDSKQFGGHIIPDEKNSIKISEVDGKTEILIPLNNINYDGTERLNFKQADWVSLLNVTNQMSFNIALNTIKTLGHIDSVEIAYKCWNPETGEETKDCELEVVQ